MSIRTIGVALFFSLVLALPVLAQTAPPTQALPPPTAAAAPINPFAEVLTKLDATAREAGSLRLIVESMQQQAATRDARIAELEKLCGDACKSKPEPAKQEPPK